MPHVPNLRSPYAKVGRLVYFDHIEYDEGRDPMVDRPWESV
jgi:hypothetical protein